MNRFAQISFLIVTVTGLMFSGCKTGLPEKGDEDHSSAISSFYIGLAALQVGDDQRAAAELEKAVGFASGEPAVWNNLGVLQMRQKDNENASASFEKAARLAPENAQIAFNQAILAQQTGDSAILTAKLNRVRELAPRDLRPLYLLALENEKLQKEKEALANFEQILKSEPDNLAALIEAARIRGKLRDSGGLKQDLEKIGKEQTGWPKEAVDQFEKIDASSAQATTEIAFLRNVLLRVPAFRASIDRIKPSDTVLGEPITRPLKLAAPDFAPAEPDLNLAFAAEAITGNPASATAVVFENGDDAPGLLVSDQTESKLGSQTFPFSFDNSNQIAVFDFDYDYKNDIAFAGRSGFKLFKQIDGGVFEDVTAKTGVTLSGELSGIWSFDFDNEGDLDLLVSGESGSYVLRNNGNGTFETLKPFEKVGPVLDFEYADIDEDGDSDAVILSMLGVVVLENERGGVFQQRGNAFQGGATAIAVGDTNGDGRLDINVLAESGAVLRFDMSAITEKKENTIAESSNSQCLGACFLYVSDFDNNGANDLIVSAHSKTEIFLGGKDGEFVKPKKQPAGTIYGFTDFNGDGKLDLAGTNQNRCANKVHQ